MSNNYGKCGSCGQPFHGGQPCGPSSALSRFIVSIANPFEEGARAYDWFDDIDIDNPYKQDEPGYVEWRAGWQHTEQQG